MILISTEPRSAYHGESIVKPSTKPEIHQKSAPLITKIKSPSVSSVIGSVRSMSIGRTIALAIPKRSAAIKAAFIPTIAIPGSTYATSSSAQAFIQIRAIRCAINYFTIRHPPRAIRSSAFLNFTVSVLVPSVIVTRSFRPYFSSSVFTLGCFKAF